MGEDIGHFRDKRKVIYDVEGSAWAFKQTKEVKYSFTPSFDRCYKKLSPGEQLNVDQAVEALILFFQKGQKSTGLGLKRLKGNIWEIRASLRVRIMFCFDSAEISFLLVGNHDDIRRWLKN